MFAERFARTAITIGGIGTIAAVSGIFLFLVWVVMPLFGGANVEGREVIAAAPKAGSEETLRLALDEGQNLSWRLDGRGTITVHDLTTGAQLEERELFEGGALPTASAFQILSSDVLFGFEDGTIRSGQLGFDTETLTGEEPVELRGLKVGVAEKYEGAIVERTGIGQLNATRFVGSLDDPVEVGDGAPIRLLDFSITPSGEAVATWQRREEVDGEVRLLVSRVREKTNLFTGETTLSLKSVDLTDVLPEAGKDPLALVLDGLGQHLYVAWKDGRVAHFDLRDYTAPRLIEEIDVIEDPAAELTVFSPLNGKQAFVAGDSQGGLTKWFGIRDESTELGDMFLTRIAEFPSGGAAVEHVAMSSRSRIFLASFADKHIAGYQATTGDRVFDAVADEPTLALAIAPKQDGVLAKTPRGLELWDVSLKHLDATVPAMFEPVWYEGYAEADHVWQSSSGANDFEPKYGMMPLVFGTLKATLYSMLFGAPLALLAALYTSEFMAPKLRAPVKSTVELMASLPSVVLGFLAALVIAPFVQKVLPATLASFLALPVVVLLGAYLWQLLPQSLSIRWQGWQRFAFILLTIPVGVLFGIALGGPLESLLFAGDVEMWLDGQRGSAFGGWFYLLLPLSGLAAAFIVPRLMASGIRTRTESGGRRDVARFDLVRFATWLGATIACAAVVSALLGGIGFDPRGGAVDTYIQRNAMIVGFAMGFAIIPIIYTLAEDALSEVPSHLREGSLGAGATQWQTATRIVIPFAMSGMFSALMIGLGRAVGETMIVLMAAGNTPIMEWNIFAGFRTLTANIAVELPEAPQGGTHYLTLFFAALVLFAITFVLNTAAELVRRHFRKRMQAL